MNINIQLKLEELAQFLLVLLILISNAVPWWAYLLLLLGPDIGMLGYIAGPRFGAITYNLLHNKGVALLIWAAGMYAEMSTLFQDLIAGDLPDMHPLVMTGLILYGHASMDRIFGYGLKYPDSFQHTHLGRIGRSGGTTKS